MNKLPNRLEIGIDECGWGPLAGPLVVGCALIGSDDGSHHDIPAKDSKAFGKRVAAMVKTVHECERTEGVFVKTMVFTSSAYEMSVKGHEEERRRLFRKAAYHMHAFSRPRRPEIILDGDNTYGIRMGVAEKKADTKFKSVGLASMAAKIVQVRALLDIHNKYPEYGFDSHHGYCTKAHWEAILKHGTIPGVHRMLVINSRARKLRQTHLIRSHKYAEPIVGSSFLHGANLFG